MRKHSKRWGRIEGGALPWILLGVVVVAIAIFLFRKPAPPAPRIQVVVATPVPVTPLPATPAPVVVQATPMPPPLVVATPTPAPATPPPMDLATVVRVPTLWPPQVALVQATAFPLSMNGRVVGEAKAPVGTVLRLLRVSGQQVEVEYQTGKHFIPVASTDLMQRALATFRKNGSVLPDPVAPVAVPPPVATAPAATPKPAASGPPRIAERIGIEVVRMKRSRTEGGDYDDKLDRIELKVKLANNDTALSADKFKGEVYIFGESILDRTAVKLLAAEPFDFSLPPRGTHELVTQEVVTRYDTTGARFGYKYEGWVLRIRDSAGNLVLAKSSSPTLLKGAEKAAALTKDKTYDRSTFKEKTEAGR